LVRGFLPPLPIPLGPNARLVWPIGYFPRDLPAVTVRFTSLFFGSPFLGRFLFLSSFSPSATIFYEFPPLSFFSHLFPFRPPGGLVFLLSFITPSVSARPRRQQGRRGLFSHFFPPPSLERPFFFLRADLFSLRRCFFPCTLWRLPSTEFRRGRAEAFVRLFL